MLLRVIKLVLFVCIPCIATAQELNFKHLSLKEGLAQSPVTSMLQDDEGFIWIGNAKGLTRYDGYEFKNFKFNPKDSTSISHNMVKVIFQDDEKRIWVGTANGLNLYNKDLETFKRIDILDIKGGRNFVSSITQDQQKNIWIGTFGGLKKLNKRTLHLEDIPDHLKTEDLGNAVIFSLFVDKDNKIWVGTLTGIKEFDPVRQIVNNLPEVLINNQNFAKNRVQVTKQDLKGNLWFGTEISGVFKYDQQKNTLTNYTYSVNRNSL